MISQWTVSHMWMHIFSSRLNSLWNAIVSSQSNSVIWLPFFHHRESRSRQFVRVTCCYFLLCMSKSVWSNRFFVDILKPLRSVSISTSIMWYLYVLCECERMKSRRIIIIIIKSSSSSDYDLFATHISIYTFRFGWHIIHISGRVCIRCCGCFLCHRCRC